MLPVSVLGATSLTGTVKDTSGQPVTGAMVKVIGVNTGLSYLVVSRDHGRYQTPELLPGRYTVQAIGGRYQSHTTEPVLLNSNQQANLELMLDVGRVIPPPAKKLTDADYRQLMPVGDGKVRELVATRCSMCHGLDRVVPARKSPQAWQVTVNRMAYLLEERDDLGGPFTTSEKAAVLDYLSTHFTPETPRLSEAKPVDPHQHLPTELLQDSEAGFVMMEFNPGMNVERHEIGIDASGNPWISEDGTPYFGWFDPDTFIYNRIEAPPGKFPRALSQIAVDPEGLVWVLDNSQTPDAELLSYNPGTKEFKTYPIPSPPGQPEGYNAPLNTLRFLDGNVWGTGNVSSRVIKLDPRTGEVTEYPSTRGSHPYGIAIADQAVWYITNYNNEIIRLDPETGEQTPYQPPTRKSGLRRMGADANGNLWAGGQDSNKLVKLNTRTGEIREFTVPTDNAAPYSVDVDTSRNLIWFSQRDSDKLGRFDPETGVFVEFPLLTAGIEARRILVDPVNPNRVWWGCASSHDRFGFIEVFE